MKRVRTKYQEFWFVEKVFCPGCGKKGLWTRDEDVADDAKPYFLYGLQKSVWNYYKRAYWFYSPVKPRNI